MIAKELKLTEERAKQFDIEKIEEPTEKDYLYIYVLMDFGGVCNRQELNKNTDIVYKAYKRKESL